MSGYGHPRAYGHADDSEYNGYDSYEGYADSYGGDSYGADPYPADSYRSSRQPPRQTPPDPYAEPTRPVSHGVAPAGPARASASVPAGRARVAASAAVAPPVPADPEAPAEPSHRYDWSGAGRQRPVAGRASVPISPAVGGTSGRATVRPGGPDKPDGPAGSGPGAGDGGPKRKKKRHWIRNSLLIALAIIVISTGGGMVALSYYVDSVPPPELTELAEGSTVLFADGREMAVLQDVNREIIDTKIPELENVRIAVVAAEDKGFYEHSGVDFMGIVRAAWNNFTGGAQQGASTIDQQYVGGVANIRGEASYSRKLQEAAMAYKMNQDYDKDDILDFYLNTIYFGRGAHGIQAAAEAYFDKDAVELTLEEAAVLAGCIRLPDDGSSLCPYDPLHTPDDPSAAEFRFRYVLGQAVAMGELDQAAVDAMVLPETVEPPDPNEPFKGSNGNIVRQVHRELEAMGIEDVATGGYQITTTIDRGMQAAARGAARRGNDAPHWANIGEDVAAGLVAIDPATGAVRAYYGGNDGTGIDLAGPNLNDAGEWYGGRPPGSTFKIYTLIAALRQGVSFESHWQTNEYTPAWASQPIRNAGRPAATNCEGTAPDYCTLRWSTIESYNVPFAYLSEAMGLEGPVNIVQAAKDAGIRMMTGVREYDDGTEAVVADLSEVEASEVAPELFYHQAAFGQYPVTVLDHASGIATLAARGVYHEPHFVASVKERVNGEWVPIRGDQISGEQRIEAQYADAITGVLRQIPGQPIINGITLANGRPSAAKTGTWEHPDGGNRDAWVVGYTPQIATAVWVGDPDNDRIQDDFGNDIGSSGLPAQIWQQFMNTAHEELEVVDFPPAPSPGDPQHPFANGILPAPPEEDEDERCQGPLRIFCDDDDDNEGEGGDDDADTNGGALLPIQPPPPPPADP